MTSGIAVPGYITSGVGANAGRQPNLPHTGEIVIERCADILARSSFAKLQRVHEDGCGEVPCGPDQRLAQVPSTHHGWVQPPVVMTTALGWLAPTKASCQLRFET